ncbi:MAG: T9SS type A sorting domain-containing protein [Bacteroidia bacterium]
MKTLRQNSYLLALLLITSFAGAQTLETFETQTNGASNYTSAGQNFTLGTGFVVQGSYPSTGWNGSAVDNVYLDNSGNSFAGVNVSFSMRSNPANKFYVKSFWVYLGDHSTNEAVSGTMTVTGKLAGVTKFSVTSGSGFVTSLGSTNGYTFINMTTYGGSNNSNTGIDEMDITTTGTYEYMGLDALTWCLALAETPTQTNLTCNGTCIGSATLTASGGVGPYTYSWSPSGGTASTASSLCAGTYTGTVKDKYGATSSNTYTITQPSALTSSVSSQTNVSCNSGSNGAVTISASGGTGTLTYAWSPSGGTAASASGLSQGSYTCTITDANSCTKNQAVTITQPSAITSSVSSQTNVSCNSGSNGAVTISASGGTGTLTYAWSPSGGTAASASGLSQGSYTCTITDANSCTKNQAVTITQPAALSATMGSPTNVTCNGAANGSVTVTPGGGTTNYTYSWSPSGGTGATAGGLSGGTYTCTVSDANACTTSATATITEPGPVVIIPAETKPGICTGGTDTLSATGAVTYTWSPSSTLNAASGSTVYATPTTNVTYTVTGTDGSGCTGTNTITVNYSTSPSTPIVTSASNVLSTSATGVSYQWYLNGTPISGATSQNYTATASGNYSVIVTNGSGCSASSASYPFTITGIATYFINDGLKLYPNPSRGNLTIELNAFGLHTELCIYDIAGRQVLTVPITATRMTIITGTLIPGVYSYRVLGENELLGTGRLVIEK